MRYKSCGQYLHNLSPLLPPTNGRFPAVVLRARRPYDANGNSLNDTFRTFTWDADGNPVTIGPVSLTYEVFDRMVEQSVSGTNSEIVYSPAGVKLALMNGATLTKAFVPLTGGATAVYTSSGLTYFRHTDHLGSSRFASTPTQTLYSDTSYSPYGEPYASSGAIDNSFTGQNQDTTTGLYDFLFREQDPNQTRWTSPDPAGLASVNPAYPQSWNRYVYVLNDPLRLIDPTGRSCDYFTDDGSEIESIDYASTLDECSGTGGTWVPDSNGEFADCVPGMICVDSSASADGNSGGFLDPIGFIDSFASAFTGAFNDAFQQIGNNIPTACGAGVFNYGPGFRSSSGSSSVSVNPNMRVADTRSGYSEGPFTDLTFSAPIPGASISPQGGVGYANFTNGGSETFLFAGLGWKVGIPSTPLKLDASLTQFASHVSGEPWPQNSFGLNLDLGFGRTGGGVGAYLNTDSITSCIEHKAR